MLKPLQGLNLKIMLKYFNYEIYTCNHSTKETGWDIKNVSVKANSKENAKENIKNFPDFDCVILFNFSHEENETSDFLITEFYPKFKILERISIEKLISKI